METRINRVCLGTNDARVGGGANARGGSYVFPESYAGILSGSTVNNTLIRTLPGTSLLRIVQLAGHLYGNA